MCGIAGIAFGNHEMRVPVGALKAMSSWIQRRGPDDEGFWSGPGIGLAHRRLSVIDLSAAGHQPMLSPDGSVVIAFNGEVYGFLELRDELKSRGAAFRSQSDTEVLLEGYLAWGMDALLERIDGMYAFALFDTRDRSLYLVRDRFGQKPLYYSTATDRISFASDIRSIWAVTDGLELDVEALDYYLAELSMPQPRTIWKQVLQVEPAHYVRIRLPNLSASSTTYWEVPRPMEASRDGLDLVDELEEKLSAAVRRIMVADVPIGCFLSGGIDSGLVAATMAGSQTGPIRTYTIGFPGSAHDERRAAAAVAGRLGTVHTELASEKITPDLVQELCNEYGEPFADASALPTFLVSRAMRQHCKVVLSGDGGDEVFGGYWEYPAASYADEIFATHPGAFRRGALRAWDALARRMFGRRYSSNVGVGHALEFAARPGYRILHRGMGFDPDRTVELYASREWGGFARQELERQWKASHHASIADNLFEASLRGRLLNDYLVKVDRAAMSSSLEVRVPFLDRGLAEFAFRLPAAEKLPGHRAKALLKKVAERQLGREAVSVQKKGFGLPLGPLLRGPLRALISEHLSTESVRRRAFFKPVAVQTMIDEHQTGFGNHRDRIWALLMLEIWCRSFLDAGGGARAQGVEARFLSRQGRASGNVGESAQAIQG